MSLLCYVSLELFSFNIFIANQHQHLQMTESSQNLYATNYNKNTTVSLFPLFSCGEHLTHIHVLENANQLFRESAPGESNRDEMLSILQSSGYIHEMFCISNS